MNTLGVKSVKYGTLLVTELGSLLLDFEPVIQFMGNL